MLEPPDLAALAALARELDGVDVPCYAKHGRDAMQPLLGWGPAGAPLCFVGRDPGATEVERWQPFVGGSGRKIREALAAHGIDAAASVFWINTVPYKPAGNKAWPLPVRRRFHAVLFPLLLRDWHGRDVVTFGKEAFLWFGLGQPDAVRRRLDDFWALQDFTGSLALEFGSGRQRRALVLHPLPHPSPANARWKKRFPELLDARLRQLGHPRAGEDPDRAARSGSSGSPPARG